MNQLLGTVMAAFAEGLVLGESLGLSREYCLIHIGRTGGRPGPFGQAGANRKGDFKHADFPLQWFAERSPTRHGECLRNRGAHAITNVAKELYRFAIREGHGEEDFSAIYDYLAHNSA